MSTNENTKQLEKIFEEYQSVPNIPFLTKHTSSYIRKILTANKINFQEDAYTIKVHFPKNNAKKLLFMAHMDHPGVVLKNNKEGIFMGLNAPKILGKIVKKNPVPLAVYSPSGKFLGKAKMLTFGNDPKQKVTIEANFDIPKNSFAPFDLAPFEKTKELYKVYNADDGIMISLMLDLILKKPKTIYDTYFVFNKHEEVYQVSAWHLAKHNILGLSEKDLIMNLECLKVESVNKNKYPKVNYENGPVLQLSNTGCLFGYKNHGKNNAEILVKTVAKNNKIPLQIGFIKDSCDSRPFTEFSLTPNICTITIPNKYKHDGADEAAIRPEEIYKKDVFNTSKLLEKIVITESNESNTESLSEKTKKQDDITDESLMKFKTNINNRLDIAYKHIVRRGYFYPQKPIDYIADLFYKIWSYGKYFLDKIR